MANALVWESVGAGYASRWRPRVVITSRARSGRPGVSTQAAALRAPASRSRDRRRPVAWRRLVALAGDILMVVVWAAMVPGLMWLGSAAGF